MYNTTTWDEKLFAGKINHWFQWYLAKDGIGHYAINFSFIFNSCERKAC